MNFAFFLYSATPFFHFFIRQKNFIKKIALKKKDFLYEIFSKKIKKHTSKKRKKKKEKKEPKKRKKKK
ncbi:hypothetical protein UF09_60 [Marinitoga camini virus 2]|nr:hypothetical protein UF09_60 [Marinitoga camini virus 2]KLO24787.1 hypothetical protein X274_02195 [Marinitoga sp. 1155]